MPWAAAAAAAAAIGGGMLQADAAKSASQTQANAANRATDTQLQMFNTLNQQQAPYRQSGVNALNQINRGFGNVPTQQTKDPNAPLSRGDIAALYNHYLGRDPSQSEIEWQLQNTTSAKSFEDFMQTPGGNEAFSARLAQGVQNPGYLYSYGDNAPVTPGTNPAIQPSGNTLTNTGQSGEIGIGQFAHSFNANDLATNLDPSYNFRRDQALGALANQLNVKGGAVSGNTLKGIMDYANNLATTGYQQAFENYQTNQTNIYNRLASIAGLGQTAGSNSSTGASTFGANVGNAQMNAGAAAAAGQVGQANAIAGGLNNAAGWYTLNQLSKPSSTSTPSYSGEPLAV